MRPVTKKEREKLKKQRERIDKARGEVIDRVVEIEATLDEVLAGYFIRPERFSKFMDILMWEDFPFSVKIKMFSEMGLGKGFEKKKKEMVRNLEKLSSFRNKIAHGLAIFNLKDKHIASGSKKGFKFISVDRKTMNDFRKKVKDVHASLRAILLHWAGVRPEHMAKSKLMWVPIEKIGSHFLSKTADSSAKPPRRSEKKS